MLQLLKAFARCKELGAVAQVHAENGDLIATVSASHCYNNGCLCVVCSNRVWGETWSLLTLCVCVVCSKSVKGDLVMTNYVCVACLQKSVGCLLC